MADLDLGGARGARAPPPWVPKFFRLHAVFGKIWQNRMLTPLWGVGATPPPTPGKPGTAAASKCQVGVESRMLEN